MIDRGVFLLLLLLVFQLQARASDSPYVKCLEQFVENSENVPSSKKLEEVRKNCRSHRLLPQATHVQFQRFSRYYLLCKNFFLKQISVLGAKKVKDRLPSCRRLAELYIRTEKPTGSKSCRAKSCFSKSGGGKCDGKELHYKDIDRSLCRRVIAPLKCMIDEKVPESVLWSYGDESGESIDERGKLNCSRI